jgi:hypothetical protein
VICKGSCKREVKEVCHDGYCRDCHVSITWESCLDGTWANDLRAEKGMAPIPGEPREPIREESKPP